MGEGAVEHRRVDAVVAHVDADRDPHDGLDAVQAAGDERRQPWRALSIADWSALR